MAHQEAARRKCFGDPKPSMLINEISKLFHNKMREKSEELGFKNGYRQILMFLSHGDGVTQLAIAEATHLKAPTVSVTLKKMEAEGLVRRETDASDMRKTHVYLLDKGRDLDLKHREAIMEFEKVMLQNISKADEQILLEYLKKIRDNILASESSSERTPHIL